jgi:hypothetical protein
MLTTGSLCTFVLTAVRDMLTAVGMCSLMSGCADRALPLGCPFNVIGHVEAVYACIDHASSLLVVSICSHGGQVALQVGMGCGWVSACEWDMFLMWAEVERPVCDVGEVERCVWDMGSRVEGRHVQDMGSGVGRHRLLELEEGMAGARCMFAVVIAGTLQPLDRGRKEIQVSMHDIIVVKRTAIKKIMAPYSQLSKTSEGPCNIIQRSLPSCGLTLPNRVSPKEERCECADRFSLQVKHQYTSALPIGLTERPSHHPSAV